MAWGSIKTAFLLMQMPLGEHSIQATKATQIMAMFAGYPQPIIVHQPHTNRNSIP